MSSPILAAFASWRMGLTLLQGFITGIPLALTMATLQAWMKDENVSLTTIGLFSLVGMPYTLKFLWAPFMDRFVPRFLGRRRGWILLCEVALIASIACMALTSPSKNPALIALLATMVAFFSASHDIVLDAYRTELFKQEEYGVANSLYVMGYRVAMLVSGGGALILADKIMSWPQVYLTMAGLVALGIPLVFFAPEPEVQAKPPRSLQDAFTIPLIEFFKRPGAIETLIFIIIYKLDTNLTVAMTTPFMMDMGFSKTEIGAVIKGYGMAATIIGTFIGGLMMLKLKLKKSLWVFGIGQALAGLTYMLLAYAGHNYPIMVMAITVENVLSGMGISALGAFMMSMCDKRFTATQYALISSFMGLSRYVAGAPSGWLAETFGWKSYYLICVLVGVPSLLMLLRYDKWEMPNRKADA